MFKLYSHTTASIRTDESATVHALTSKELASHTLISRNVSRSEKCFLKIQTAQLPVTYSLPTFLQKQLKEALCTCLLLVLTSVFKWKKRQWMLSWNNLLYLWLQRFSAWRISSIPVPFTFLATQGDKESVHRHNTCDMGQSNGIRTVQWNINEFTVMTAQQCQDLICSVLSGFH